LPFDAIFVPDAMRAAVDDRAWLSAMLEAEAALARAQARAGVIPAGAGEAVAAVCADPDRFDVQAIARAARADGNPVRALVAAADTQWFHYGATSQDIVDTAAMLVSRRALALVLGEIDAWSAACAALADTHRSTLMAGRTLMQLAEPTTFGLKAAGWLDAVLDARDELAVVDLAVQLGGAAGTLAFMGEAGPDVVRDFAAALDLGEPRLPWHVQRGRVAALGSALALAAGALGKSALDVQLLAQDEVGEVRSGHGGSSSMPHKQNPVEAIRVRACATRVAAAAGLLLAGVSAHEHERAAGAWHAEWAPLTEALALTGGAAAAAREMLDGLEVQPDRMRQNLDMLGAVEPYLGSVHMFIDRALERQRG
jgi:3-carboxy-cis,cis-muconate cycloisomerase